MTANKEIEKLKAEIKKLNEAPAKIKYTYEPRCDYCNSTRYERLADEAEKAKNEAEEYKATARKEWREAEKSRKHFYSLVNNYTLLIEERVSKIVAYKTRSRRFSEWLGRTVNNLNSLLFFIPLIYSFFVTLLAFFRNEIVSRDFIAVGKSWRNGYRVVFRLVKILIHKIAGLSEFIPNPTIQGFTRWVLLILSFVILIAAVLWIMCLLDNASRFIYDKLNFELNKTFNTMFLSVVLADIGVVVFCGDKIKSIVPINLVLTFIIIFSAYAIIKIAALIIQDKAFH